jgi:hypothetical protein
MTQEESPVGTAKTVQNYDLFCEGDTEPHLGKRINTLILKQQTFIVYLDEDDFVEWAYTPEYQLREGVGDILNRVSEAQALPTSHLTTPQLCTFRQLIGEAVARALQGDLSAGHDAVDRAVKWLDARNTEVARSWYLTASSTTALVASLATLTLWVFRDHATALAGRAAFEVAMGGGAGALGAFLSTLLGNRPMSFDPSANRRLHIFQGAAGILAGWLGAMLVAIGVKGQVFLSVTASTAHPFAALIALCMIAGTSERLVPAFVEKVEISGGIGAATSAHSGAGGSGSAPSGRS